MVDSLPSDRPPIDRTAAGVDVVLIVPESGRLGSRPPGPGRLAVLVGSPDDEATLDAAVAMGAEVFGV